MSFRRNLKVRFFTGARIQDMYFFVVGLLHKRSDKIILHVDKNDAPNIKTNEILEEFGKIREMLSSVKIILSAPTITVGKQCK